MFKWSITQWLASGFLLFCLYAIAMLSARNGIQFGLLFSFLPLIIISVAAIISNPYWGLMAIFILNYFIMGISRYVTTASLGVTTDIMIIFTMVSFIVQSAFRGDVQWHRIKSNSLIVLLTLWFVYCLIEIVNPSSVLMAWVAAIRFYAIYPLVVLLFTTVLFYRYKTLKTIVFLWAILTLTAVAKVVMQQRLGWDSGELRWLNEGNNFNTHILATGIRYFSFFTDAGNFGSSMGCSLVVFSISSFFVKDKRLSIFYLLVATAAGYGMFVSGTRGALAVPFAGYVLYTILSKNVKSMVVVGTIIAMAYFFFNYTYIGQDNQYIRRMRTAFDTNDASLLVRQENQRKLAEYMKAKPFGEGLGLSGTEAQKYAPGRLTTSIPNDSWFVKVWVETGVIGLIFHIGLLLYAVGYGVYIILKRIKDRELRGILAALLCGLTGMIVSAYGNAFFVQYPNGILMYMIQAFLFMGIKYDEEIETSIQITDNERRNLA